MNQIYCDWTNFDYFEVYKKSSTLWIMLSTLALLFSKYRILLIENHEVQLHHRPLKKENAKIKKKEEQRKIDDLRRKSGPCVFLRKAKAVGCRGSSRKYRFAHDVEKVFFLSRRCSLNHRWPPENIYLWFGGKKLVGSWSKLVLRAKTKTLPPPSRTNAHAHNARFVPV